MKQFLLLGLFILISSCSEKQSAFESPISKTEFKTKSFYATNIVQRRTAPSLGLSRDTTVIGKRTFKDQNGDDFYEAYSRSFFQFSFKDDYINKSNGLIQNRITQNIEFVIRVDQSLDVNDLENFGLNQNLKLKLVNEPFLADTVFRTTSTYWSANRNSEAVDNGTSVIDLDEQPVTSGSTNPQEYTFSFDKDLYVQKFLNSDTIAEIGALLLDATNLSGSIRLDTMPYLKITYLDANDSTITDNIYATQAQIWNSYTYLGDNINTDFSIRSGDREGLVFEFDRDAVVSFIDSVIPFGANFSFKINSLTQQIPELEIRQVTGYENTIVGLYNDGLDYGPTFTAGFYVIEKIDTEDRLINESDRSGDLISQMINTWTGTNKLYGKVFLERTGNSRPAIIQFPKPAATDTLYRLNIYYIDREVN